MKSLISIILLLLAVFALSVMLATSAFAQEPTGGASSNVTTATIVAIVAAIPPTLAAFASLWVAVSNGRKTDTVINKVDVVHALTNDAKSKADAALAVANETINGLEKLNAALSAKHEPPPKTTKKAAP